MPRPGKLWRAKTRVPDLRPAWVDAAHVGREPCGFRAFNDTRRGAQWCQRQSQCRTSTDRMVGKWRASSLHVSPSLALAKIDPLLVPK